MCRPRTVPIGVVLVCLLGWAPGATAAEAEAQLTKKLDKSWGELEGDAGFGFLGPDLYTTLQVGFDFQEGAFAMGVQLRLRVRVVDRGEERQGLGVRREDWDEASDLAYLLRYATYRRTVRGVAVGFAVGELSGYTLGNGSLVRDYGSAVDLDHPHAGFATRLSGRRFRLDLLLDDLVQPEFAALRVALLPVTGRHSLTVGASGLLDFRAPLAAMLDAEGARRVDAERNLRVRRALLGGVGLDVAYQLGDVERDHLRVYLDGNLLVPGREVAPPGLGLHLGVAFQARPFRADVAVSGGLEYRRLGPGYLPGWVDLLYDVQRLQLPLTRRAQDALGGEVPTKLGGLAAGLAPGGNAWRGEVGLRVGRHLEGAAHYEHRPGLIGKAVGGRLTAVIGTRLLATLLVERFGVVAAEDLGRPSGLLVSAEARYRPTRYLYVLAQYSRLMHLRESGLYRPLDQLNVALGGAWGY